jgi:hypothetical protein
MRDFTLIQLTSVLVTLVLTQRSDVRNDYSVAPHQSELLGHLTCA